MTISTATAPTASASRYLQQLCKHWGHKFPVEFTSQHGVIQLPLGACALDADEQALHIRLDPAAGDSDLARFEQVVAEHLQRFAFREELTIEWRRS
ncbi:DUF2218 domain-containing protein [Phenylobacterium deserti]|uniref:DUF2218 domain-containing protein n=1 Tax=Phenylobacterium deserti TaxID=1914756 RepID=A0A328AV31_9CAUL|nr:DUF2218 domain-containing protein [Phenylobacterium deserti]RAK56778.1 DUF2218 domain-containing protein [Phenylobacterium deserti]